MNKKFSLTLMRSKSGLLNYQVRGTEIYAGFSLDFFGKKTIDYVHSFLVDAYYDGLVGSGVLYFAPSIDALNSDNFNIDTHLLSHANQEFEPLCHYDEVVNTTTFNIVVRYFMIAESSFFPDQMYQLLCGDFARLIGKKECLNVIPLGVAEPWFEEDISN